MGDFKNFFDESIALKKIVHLQEKPNTHLMMFHLFISFQPSIMMKQPYSAQDSQ
jgi:hypothetical protein